MIVAARHYWRTADGRLVETGHLDAEVLAYPKGTELPDDEARRLGLLAAAQPESPQAKQAPLPANKARGRTADK